MIKAVLDTNVIISALFWKGTPYEVVKAGIKGEFQIIISENILKEIKDNLLNKFKIPLDETNQLVRIVLVNSLVVLPPHKKVKAVKADPSDNKILECALSGESRFVVSGDKHLLGLKQYKDIKIITPQKFLKIIKKK